MLHSDPSILGEFGGVAMKAAFYSAGARSLGRAQTQLLPGFRVLPARTFW